MSGRATAIGLVLWIMGSLAAGWVGSAFMPGAWYESLVKPAWTPPSVVFGPVWTALYIMMGTAAWLVWRRAGFSGAAVVLGLFIAQLVLNTLWSWIFFGLRNPGAAFIEIIVLWVAILAVLIGFWRVRTAAGVLLLPYLAWVTFAAGLNMQIWRLNA